MARQGITHLEKSMRFEYFFNDLHQTGRRWAAGAAGLASKATAGCYRSNRTNQTAQFLSYACRKRGKPAVRRRSGRLPKMSQVREVSGPGCSKFLYLIRFALRASVMR